MDWLLLGSLLTVALIVFSAGARARRHPRTAFDGALGLQPVALQEALTSMAAAKDGPGPTPP